MTSAWPVAHSPHLIPAWDTWRVSSGLTWHQTANLTAVTTQPHTERTGKRVYHVAFRCVPQIDPSDYAAPTHSSPVYSGWRISAATSAASFLRSTGVVQQWQPSCQCSARQCRIFHLRRASFWSDTTKTGEDASEDFPVSFDVCGEFGEFHRIKRYESRYIGCLSLFTTWE